MAAKLSYEELTKRLKKLERETEKRKQLESHLREKSHELSRRVNELNCLYGISNLVEEPDASLPDIIQGTVDHLSASCRFPGNTWARIKLGEKQYVSNNFQDSDILESVPIMVHGKEAGTIEVGCLKDLPECHTISFRTEEKKLFTAIAQRLGKIIEREQAEGELRKLSHAVQQSPSAIMITDPGGVIEYCNPKYFEITGFSQDEIIGTNTADLGDQPPEETKRLWDEIAHGGTWHGEFHNRKKNGESYWESASISAITDEQGNITHYVKVSEDITKLKEAHEALQESEKKVAVLKFANEMSLELMHELRNPLVALGGLSRLLATKEHSLDKIKQYCRTIADQGERLENALNKVLEHLKTAARSVLDSLKK